MNKDSFEYEPWVKKCLTCKHAYRRQTDAEELRCRCRKGCNYERFVSAEAVCEEAQTERTGRWYIIEYEFFTCDQCGEYVPSYAESTSEAKEMLNNGDYPNYCPNCGAKMTKGGDNNEID